MLATVAGEYPLLVELPHGKGRVFWINSSTDRGWGDLPLSQVYVPFVQQLARARELSIQAATSCWVGEGWPDLSRFASGASWPAGDAGSPVVRAVHSGLHDAVSEAGKSQWSCAVNVRREESDLHPVNSEKLKATLPGRIASGSEGVRDWRDQIRREVPMWPWLLGVAVTVFLIEGWASMRAARRRELAAGGVAPAPPPTGPRARAGLWGRRPA